MLLFLAFRNIPQGHISMVEGRWDRKKYMGTELKDKTLGLVGCGVIGTQLAKYAQAFGFSLSFFVSFFFLKHESQWV